MPLTRRTLIGVALSLALSLTPSAAVFAASPAPAKGEHGMVVTAQHLATEVGVDVLKKGGNAVDAAVAVGYALAVVYPNAGNIGGGGFMTVRMKDGRTTFIDFRERAPLAATKTMYLDKDGNPMKGASLDGYLAVGVPGSVAGFEMAREKYGTQSRQDLMAPAIAYARDGFVLNQGDAASFAGSADRLAKDPAAAAIFLKKDGKPYGIGEKLVQPDLAASLSAISEKGPDAFYKGAIADEIVKASGAKGGILAKGDFEQYAVRELKPVTCDYRGYEIISSPPPSSGGVIICEILNVLEGYPLSYLGSGSAETVHVMVEAMRHAYVDRNSALGDPDFVDNPVSKLLDKNYAKNIRDKIDPFRAGVSKDLMPKGFGESKETTHYSIIDNDGNAVAVTYTLNGSFGAGVVADGTGILLNNEMDDFTQKPGVPNLYGLVQGEANAIQPKKTPLSSMSPTIVTRDGKPFMVIGSPGGSRIITITLEAIVNVIDHRMNIQQAIDAPRIHHQWLPDTIYVEPFGLSPDTERLLAGMGYHLDLSDQTWGQAAGILVGGKSLGEIEKGGGARYNGAIDSRAAAGEALGY
ncbi:gamma-glutamyltransferase [Mesorhizobium sp. M2D.F.Ca.ET.185.01.1.1]|uniref:gamma-glutamyltransferase n=2 Tax=Mesorhizobium TaxID=68287 RepID=UPI000FCB135A|nr:MULTISPECIES: gamma-glutamyltransferase [unclassified Mesorhizobium]TGP73389.1 gamma-glutamyltransferase [bacterium M00.F.Ca.ET.227.01.1.1]TGP84401.1 gamma-glutamyltransferase [bacterium M00.F.Ca.ET.221.01.1.1]TGP87015.1 gamma-glutamyltransferase [bacterium M00.F.Ca.ET.222.01.1.1]TGT97300.1 gamma-glutamyltransferase [bacterium M00.F.Ca.ET.163.01.1.1]TGU22492.1 gamma-glutamyltransferase [bacterium M00.F.Ca.ET.156.01.1.1]TGU43174.1 gamma-glutamyltransferase [bacterium M00.F.Ca.ET.146.01.1.1]